LLIVLSHKGQPPLTFTPIEKLIFFYQMLINTSKQLINKTKDADQILSSGLIIYYKPINNHLLLTL